MCFDDVPDGATPAQEALQVDLAAALQRQHPALDVAFLHGSYSVAPKSQEKALALLDAALAECKSERDDFVVGCPD